MTKTIDLNADLGEGCGTDEALMPLVSSCNIACGGHAGDMNSIRNALELAKRHEVAFGAHPSYPDREGFGRRPRYCDGRALDDALTDQLQVISLLSEQGGVRPAHVKPHGALYNDAAGDRRLAELVVRVLVRLLPGTSLVGPPGSALASAAASEGIRYIAEGFVDRRYRGDGSLVPRTEDGALIAATEDRVSQAVALASGAPVATTEGERFIRVETLCLHGDSDGAVQSARMVRAALLDNGFDIRAPHG